MRLQKLLPVIIITGYLTACSVLSPVPNQVSTSYMLQPDQGHIHFKHAKRQVLAIALPSTPPIYDTTMMAYSLHPLQLAYYVKNQWAEKPSAMIQALLVQRYQQANVFQHVTAIPTIGRYDVMLVCNIYKMQQDFSNNLSVMNISLQAQLIARQSLKTIASKKFAVIMPVMEKYPASGVLAANQGINLLVDHMILWTAKQLR